MSIFGFTLHTIGEILIAITVLRVHGRVVEDQKVDKAVLKEMKLEQLLGVTGIILIGISI